MAESSASSLQQMDLVKEHVCDISFQLQRSLINHQTKHAEVKSHNREQCLKSFCNSDELKSHMEKSHEEKNSNKPREKKANCNQCEYTAASKAALKAHRIVEAHYFPCSVCSLSYKTPASLKMHKLSHREEIILSFNCRVCSSLYQKKQKLEFCLALLEALGGWYGDPTKRFSNL